jgi:hypothetical protein
MSTLGHLADITARSRHVRYSPKADINQRIEHVCFVPKADIVLGGVCVDHAAFYGGGCCIKAPAYAMCRNSPRLPILSRS